MSRYEREKFSRQEEDLLIYAAAGWICVTCGNSVHRYGRPQLAHLIAETIPNYSKYGKEIIDHPLNRAPVCCLDCNGRQNIGGNPGKCRDLLELIRAASPEISNHIDWVIEKLQLPDPNDPGWLSSSRIVSKAF